MIGDCSFILEDVKCSPKICFCVLQSTIPRSSCFVLPHKHKCSHHCHRSYSRLYNPRSHEAIHRRRYPYTTILTCVRFAVKLFNLLQACVVTWRSIRESLSSSVKFTAASFVMNVMARNI